MDTGQDDDINDDSWRDGEYAGGTSVASRLIFNYASPLLDIASHRRLVTRDAFRVPRERSMVHGAVGRLRDAYYDGGGERYGDDDEVASGGGANRTRRARRRHFSRRPWQRRWRVNVGTEDEMARNTNTNTGWGGGGKNPV